MSRTHVDPSDANAGTTADPLLAVLAYLSGDHLSPENVAGSLADRHLRCMARLLHYRISTRLDEDNAEQYRGLLASLSDAAAERLLRAPSVCEALRTDDRFNELSRLIENECAADVGIPRNDWSPTGDVWLGETRPDEGGLAARAAGLGSPRLACGTPLDHSLPSWLEHPSSGLVSPRALTAAEIDTAVARIDQALAIVRHAYPAGFSVFSGLVRNLVLRVDDARPHECWAATSGLAIGRVVVVNPHIGPVAQLGEVLLHEATHCALDIVELEHPMLRRAQLTGADTRVLSPWSGSPLSAHALVHASVVWAVLHNYWDRLSGVVDEELVTTRRRYIRRGFERTDPTLVLEPVRHVLSEQAPDVTALAWASVA